MKTVDELLTEDGMKADKVFKKIVSSISPFGYNTTKLYLLSFDELDLLKNVGLVSDTHVAMEKMYREQMSKDIWK